MALATRTDWIADGGVQGGGRLVEDDELRGGHDCAGETEALRHAA